MNSFRHSSKRTLIQNLKLLARMHGGFEDEICKIRYVPQLN